MGVKSTARLDEWTRAMVVRRRDRFAMLLGVLTPLTRDEAIELFKPLPPSERSLRAGRPRIPVDVIDEEHYRRIAV